MLPYGYKDLTGAFSWSMATTQADFKNFRKIPAQVILWRDQQELDHFLHNESSSISPFPIKEAFKVVTMKSLERILTVSLTYLIMENEAKNKSCIKVVSAARN